MHKLAGLLVLSRSRPCLQEPQDPSEQSRADGASAPLLDPTIHPQAYHLYCTTDIACVSSLSSSAPRTQLGPLTGSAAESVSVRRSPEQGCTRAQMLACMLLCVHTGVVLGPCVLRHLARSRAGNQCLLLSTGQQSAGIPAPAMCTRKGYWSIVWCTAQ